MRDALHRATDLALLLWWLPTILFAAASALALICGVGIRLRRIRRLTAAGRHDEALRVYTALQRDLSRGTGRPKR